MTTKCGKRCEIFSRVVGYHRRVDDWNRGKKEEFKENFLSQRREQTLNLWLQQIWEKAKIVDNSSLFFSP